MPGAVDPEYILARRVLLDALVALGRHRDSVILVGAQAIYIHVGEADIAVAPYTTDGDLAIDPSRVAPEPLLGDALSAAGFTPDPIQPGQWTGEHDVRVDLMVPESLAGSGRRGADLGPHGRRVARRARGLEASLVDNSKMQVEALEPGDGRRFDLRVAGPAALLVAKIHKIAERQGSPDRLADKDALDVLRILRGVRTEALAQRLRQLAVDDLAGEVTRTAMANLEALFGSSGSPGSQMAARAAEPLEDPATIAASCAALTSDLLGELS